MQYNSKKKYLFCHIPKTAGRSIENVLFGKTYGGHYKLSQFNKFLTDYNEYYKFTIVRNPYDRLVSTYSYLQSGRMTGSKKYKCCSFAAFCTKLHEFSGLDHIKPQSYFLDDKINYVGRFETLYNSYSEICKNINVTAELPHDNKSSHKDYRSYYTPELQKIVYDFYQDDFINYNYPFDL